MKKSAISMFALAAIVIAVASSFTTSSSKFASAWFEVVNPATVVDMEDLSKFVVTPLTSGDAQSICPLTSNKICAIEHEYTGGTSSTQLDQVDLNNFNPTSIKYRD